MEKLVQTLRNASGIPVSVGWKPVSNLPAATLQMRNCEITPLDLSHTKHLIDTSFQIDIWHHSAKARDESVDKMITGLEQSRQSFAEDFGVFGFAVEGLADVDDEKAFRKMMLIRLRMVG